MINIKERSTEKEIMEDLRCEGEVVERTLKELDKINLLLGGNKVTISALENCMQKIKDYKTIKIADLGCGSGDILRIICRKLRKKDLPVLLTGIDANPFIIDYAVRNSVDYPEITYRCLNVFSEDFYKEKFDIVNCTLFCHHFDNGSLCELLKKLKDQTTTAIIINDIHRHWLAFHSIKLLTRLFSSSAMIKNDSAVSVLRAFRRKELSGIIEKAGYKNYSIKWKWAFRFEVIIWVNN
jgi:2-polyprenyl-3-methyl-5-hydroxy-6-metoxy-1,4-benzoquinol methylase